jgi:hypothetical protein
LSVDAVSSGPRRAAGLALLLLTLVFAVACEREPAPQAIPDAEVPALLSALTEGDAAAVKAALVRIEETGDTRFVPVLIEIVHANQLGLAARHGYNDVVVSLEHLTGTALGGDWYAWAEWYQGSELGAPPGFTNWKGSLLARIDPRFAEFLDGELPIRIRPAEIDWGGVAVEGIPALDDPAVVAADQASFLAPEDIVFGVAFGDEARAYPLRILDWHELANDTVGGVPFALAYCTLCGSGIAWDARQEGGAPRRFATSGLLYRSNKLMFDTETRTLWNQLTGEPVLGPLAADPTPLAILPMVTTTWADWQAQHPDTTVLSLETGHERPYVPGEPYGDYFQSSQKLFPVHPTRDDLPPKERVYGVRSDDVAKAWSVTDLVAQPVLNDAVGEAAVVLVTAPERLSVSGADRPEGFLRYDAGATVRVYERVAQRFEAGPQGGLRDEEGGAWTVGEDALEGPDGERLPRIGGTLAYWFAWQAFHPETVLYRP